VFGEWSLHYNHRWTQMHTDKNNNFIQSVQPSFVVGGGHGVIGRGSAPSVFICVHLWLNSALLRRPDDFV
jgi:hypothetical protein